MQGSTPTRPWLEKVGDLVESLGHGEPLTVLLGAGASRTSGAPSTEAVEAKLLSVNRGRMKSREDLYDTLDGLPEYEKQQALRPLFEGLDPFIGYHCLAAIARERPVYVVNLNWDDAMTIACERLGVPCVCVERDDPLPTIRRKLRSFQGSGRGVFCLHLHNRLGSVYGIHLSTYETLSFPEGLKEILTAEFFRNHTLIVGASLIGEHDVTDLLRQLVFRKKADVMAYRPFWIFSRQPERSTMPIDRLQQHLLYEMKSQLNFVGDPAVDFDRLLLELSSRLADESFPGPQAPASVPALDDLAIPSREIVGRYIAGGRRHALVIEGDASIGKTSAAYLMQFLSLLCDEPKPDLRFAEWPAACVRELRAFVTAQRSGVHPNRILVLENPFGTTGEFEDNPELVRLLRRFAGLCGARRPRTRDRVIITTRSSCWRAAIARHGKDLRDLPSTSLQAAKWYRQDELAAFLEARVHGTIPQARREIANGELATPVAIEDAVGRSRGNSRRPGVIAEKRAFLSVLDEGTAWVAVLARLQELCSNSATDLPLCQTIDDAEAMYATIEHMVTRSTLDGHSYFTPAHSTDREAIDAFYAEEAARFEDRLRQLKLARGDISAACALWEAIRAARTGDLEPMWKLDLETRRDWMPTFLEEASRANKADAVGELFEKARLEDHDFWSLRELVFEMTRLWPQLHAQEHTQRFLDELLAAPDVKGRYVVLEAMLYLQAATYPDAWDLTTHAEVWEKLTAARWSLFRDGDWTKPAPEIALILDALVWCPPRIPEEEMSRWLIPLKQAAEAHTPLAAAYLVSALYHPHGCRIFQMVGEQHPAESFGRRPLISEEAAMIVALVQWHFVHQSRARALLYRRNLEPAHGYLLQREAWQPPKRMLDPELARSFEYVIKELARFPEYAGWAIHLGMNVYATLGRLDVDFLAAIVEETPPADPGLVTAVMTYKIPRAVRHALVTYFKDPVSRAALLDAMRDAPAADGTRVAAPRFNALRAPRDIHSELELRWSALERDDLPLDDQAAFVEHLQRSAHAVLASCRAQDRTRLKPHLWDVVRWTQRGDYRLIEDVAGRKAERLDTSERLRERLTLAAWKLAQG